MSPAARCIVLITLFLLSACGSDQCRITSFGDLTVLNNRGSPLIEATINGHHVALIVDTGAFSSILWPGEADKLGLEPEVGNLTLKGTGGYTSAGVATANTVILGSGKASDVLFVTAGKHLENRSINGIPIVGIFGSDFLSHYDIVFDLPQHRINLYGMDGCRKYDTPEWSGKVFKVHIDHQTEDKTKILVPVKINNHTLDFVLDSGAYTTLITRSDASKAGVNKAALSTDQKNGSRGIDGRERSAFLHQFSSMQVGPFLYRNPTIAVERVFTSDSLLGADFLRGHRVWIPHGTDYIFMQPAVPAPQLNTSAEAQREHPASH